MTELMNTRTQYFFFPLHANVKMGTIKDRNGNVWELVMDREA